ncbi:MAG: endolytic transglycosylase MltG [Gammaproteobacteria bacterium]|nr:endolytic transglycosylase MltG [Pseudomonadales bacterium]MCP5346247.1 endolytic transglycosylase MltG [Pseudomonadales bacterium]
MPFINRIKRPWLLLAVSAVLLTVVIVIAGLRAWALLNSPLALPGSVIFDVPAGSSLGTVSDELAAQGWLETPLLFKLWSRYSGHAGRLQAGEYELEPALTPVQLLEKLVAGDVKQYQLTLVEGWTFTQALETIQSSPGIAVTLGGLSAEEIAERLAFHYANPEGQLFPDTYFYTRGTTDAEILSRAHRRLLAILEEVWAQRLGVLPLDSPYQALILASIVEKETAVAAERPQIAGVFIRRLEQNMRLQSDPTVIYGMGERYNGNIDRAALNEVTPYNTYRINGLPPTPIALSGREAIIASVNPDAGAALYFVARGDGSHQFSATLDEHNAAVRRYQLGENVQ